MENMERKYKIGDYVYISLGGNPVKGRISRQNNFHTMKHNEYFVHTMIGTFLMEEEYIFEYSE